MFIKTYNYAAADIKRSSYILLKKDYPVYLMFVRKRIVVYKNKSSDLSARNVKGIYRVATIQLQVYETRLFKKKMFRHI